MKLSTLAALAVLLLSWPLNLAAQVAPVPSLMNFQGRLTKPDGTPAADGAYSIQFSLYNTSTGGTLLWQRSLPNVPVNNGTFAVRLDFTGGFQNSATLASVFGASAVFLEIKVGTDAPLAPRQQLVTVAYALKANSVPDGSITSASIADGTIAAADIAPGGFNTLAWLLNGNSGTTGSQFLGTTDNQPLVFRTNNQRALQMQYVESGSYFGINLLGGYGVNSIQEGVTGATVFGGIKIASSNYPNSVTDHGGTVSGGVKNRAGNGNVDFTDAFYATVGGGFQNLATSAYATVGGGRENIADGIYATVAGGWGSAAYGTGAASGGGFFNIAIGDYSTTPGGYYNVAYAPYSFAAGRTAKARHEGAFVWGDSTATDMNSTGVNQFLIRASGGVGINTNAPTAQLEVNGGSATGLLVRNANGSPWAIRIHNDAQPNFQTGMYVTDNGQFRITSRISGGAFAQLSSSGTWSASSDRRLKTDIQPLSGLLDKALSLRPVSYYFIRQDRMQTPLRQIGFIAQEVEELFPALVEGADFKTLNYAGLSVVAIGALQEQQKQMEALKSKMDRLNKVEAENAELRAKNAAMEARLAAIEQALAELKIQRK